MKFKYYLRGAGIGIIVTTVILSAASLFQDHMSDAEIIQRAMELGMVMEEGSSGTLADIPSQGKPGPNTTSDDGQGTNGDGQSNTSGDDPNTDNPSDTSGDDPNTDNPSDTSDGSQGSEPIDNEAEQPDSSSESGKNIDNDANKDKDSKQDADSKKQSKDKEKITIKVEGGEVSRMVSQKIFEAGLVDDAEEFNKYLGDNGYASFLQPGTYHIKKGASFQQIAEILTNK